MSVATFTTYMDIYSEVETESLEDFDLEEEREIVLQCQGGDVDAMEVLVLRYQQWGYNIAYGILGHHEDAQDVTQDAFLSVWQNIGQFKFKSRFSTWFYRIVKNKALNLINQRQRRKTEPMDIDDTQPWVPLETETPERLALLEERKRLVHEALARLKENHRTILVLRELQELSYNEIAEVVGCTLGRVKSRLHEARKALKAELEKIDYEW